MFNRNRIDVINTYNNLIKKQQALADEMSNIGRQKDYEVQKIEKKYQSKIDNLVREQAGLSMLVDSAKRYVEEVSCDQADIVSKICIKKRDR